MRPFEGKTAVVLGASAPGNCGWEIAKQLAEQGARVTVAARRMEGLRALAGLIGGLAVYCDTSVEEDLETLAEATAAEHGPIDIAISAAGFRSWERSTPSLQI